MKDYLSQTKFPNMLMRNSFKERSHLQRSPFNRNLLNLPVCAISSANFPQLTTVKRYGNEVSISGEIM